MTKKEWKKLDRIIEKQSKEDKDYKCEVCGRGKEHGIQLHSHHYIGRTHTSLRWVLENIFVLCAAHHTMSRQSAHEDPQWFDSIARDIRGEKWYKLIEKIKNNKNKKTFEENKYLMDKSLEEVLKSYEDSTI